MKKMILTFVMMLLVFAITPSCSDRVKEMPRSEYETTNSDDDNAFRAESDRMSKLTKDDEYQRNEGYSEQKADGNLKEEEYSE